MINDNPFMVWNSPEFEEDPTAPHNRPDIKDDPFKPWNDPFGDHDDLTPEEREYYGILLREHNTYHDEDYRGEENDD